MRDALEMNKVSTLATVLLSNLDEGIFFSQLSAFINDQFVEHKVQIFQAFHDGSTQLVSENNKIVENGLVYNKSKGLSGYVVSTKRAYYSNSKRDPLLASTKRDDCVVAELCVPVISNGDILATIHIQSSNEERKFTDEDTAFLLTILDHIASPINNMRLYLIAKNLNRELENKIKEKEQELMNRGPALNNRAANTQKIEMIGNSNKFVEIMTIAQKVAKEDFPILIAGESGTGKKLLAKKIHTMSERKDAECILVHCNAIEDKQLELELFGTTQREGILQKANGGTIILEGVGAIGSSVQDKLLRFIVSGEFYNVDSQVALNSNVRIISITKNSLEQLCSEEKFNKDLMYRLNIMNIKMPSLKERKEDIKILSEHFLNQSNKNSAKMITSKAVEKLMGYGWSGNIHELKNLMERTAILVSEQFIDETHLPDLQADTPEVEEEIQIDFSEMTLHDLEQMHIVRTLDHLNGNKTRAAKALGITVKTLYNKLHSYGLVHAKAE